jgi:hypothetical protein
MRPTVPVALVALLSLTTVVRPDAQTLTQQALAEAAAYLSAMTSRLPGVVIEEHYVQQTTSTLGDKAMRTRSLQSDVVVMADERLGWVEFRDVFQVDGQVVRDRQDRIMSLFAEPAADAGDHARSIAREGARYNLDVDGVSFERTLNQPLAALRFLQPGNQRRSRFEPAGRRRCSAGRFRSWPFARWINRV